MWGNKLVLGAISLDLFAVLLGGATGLLPVFARDVLGVGPRGVRRPAGRRRRSGPSWWPGTWQYRPIRTRAGVKMLLAVGLFGLMTVVFAFSRSVPLSVFALAVLGGADMVSVFTRQSLVQIATPDRMRGRVSAVSTLFIGASNELGEFESGVVARVLGPVGAVAFGGAGAMAVTAVWAWLFPRLRDGGSLGVSPQWLADEFAPRLSRPHPPSRDGSHPATTARPATTPSILATSAAIRSSRAGGIADRGRHRPPGRPKAAAGPRVPPPSLARAWARPSEAISSVSGFLEMMNSVSVPNGPTRLDFRVGRTQGVDAQG